MVLRLVSVRSIKRFIFVCQVLHQRNFPYQSLRVGSCLTYSEMEFVPEDIYWQKKKKLSEKGSQAFVQEATRVKREPRPACTCIHSLRIFDVIEITVLLLIILLTFRNHRLTQEFSTSGTISSSHLQARWVLVWEFLEVSKTNIISFPHLSLFGLRSPDSFFHTAYRNMYWDLLLQHRTDSNKVIIIMTLAKSRGSI